MLVSQEARAALGAFQTANQGCLSSESGVRSASAQLDNRRRQLGPRLRSLPEGDQARELECVVPALGFVCGVETTVLPAEVIPLRAAIIAEDQKTTKQAAEGPQPPGLSISTDDSRIDSGEVGYAVTWKRGLQWRDHKVHMGFQQGAHDVKCAAIARALETTALRPLAHKRITIYASMRMPKQRSKGRAQMSLVLARGMLLRQGNTSRPSVGEGRKLHLNSAGALCTRGFQGMRRRINGQSWQQTSRTLTVLNIFDLGGTAAFQNKDGNPQVTGTYEALDSGGQVAGSKGMGSIYGF